MSYSSANCSTCLSLSLSLVETPGVLPISRFHRCLEAGLHAVFCSVAVRGGVNVQSFSESSFGGSEQRSVQQEKRPTEVIRCKKLI